MNKNQSERDLKINSIREVELVNRGHLNERYYNNEQNNAADKDTGIFEMFKFRLFLAILLFFVFIYFDENGFEIASFKCNEIVEMISDDVL